MVYIYVCYCHICHIIIASKISAVEPEKQDVYPPYN